MTVQVIGRHPLRGPAPLAQGRPLLGAAPLRPRARPRRSRMITDALVARIVVPRLLETLRESWRVGRLAVEMPDGQTHAFGPRGRRPVARGSGSRARPSSAASSSGATWGWASPTWTGSGRPTTSPTFLTLAAENEDRLDVVDPAHEGPQPGQRRPPPPAAEHPPGQPEEHRRPLRPLERVLRALPRRDHDLLQRACSSSRTSPWPTPSATSTGPWPRRRSWVRETTSSRWAAAGAASPSSPRASTAAGSPGSRSRSVSTPWPGTGWPRPDSQDRVEIRLQDYRDVTGTFDKIVSIEMFEALGREHWPVFFAKLDEVLAPHGLVALQTISLPDHRFEEYARHCDWIQRYIFPGSLLASLHHVTGAMSRVEPPRRAPPRGHRPPLRPHPRPLAPGLSLEARRGAGPRLRRPLHPDVGLLPGRLRGLLRHPAPGRPPAGPDPPRQRQPAGLPARRPVAA